MGRAFEYRKATKLKRWGHMAKTFTRLNTERTSPTVRVVLSVSVSTKTAMP